MGFKIPVEVAVERMVRQVGGLPGRGTSSRGVVSSLPLNADFVFQKYRIVGELKRLDEEPR